MTTHRNLLKKEAHMKKIVVLFVLVVLAALIGFISCGGGGGSSSGSGGSGNNALFNAVKATTPAFTATVSATFAPAVSKTRGLMATAPTFTNQAMNMAFQLLRNYSYPADEGKVDMSNIYKVLHEAGGYLDGAASICSSITLTTDSAISAYAFSDFLGQTYDCGGNVSEAAQAGYGSSVAYRENNGTGDKFMLATYKWAPDSTQQIAIGAIETRFNSTSNDVELTFAQSVWYPPSSAMGGTTGSGFATRTHITGNSVTHAFELITAMSNTYGGMALVGKGISQGAGNYFLIKQGADYYCLPAGATEDDLRSIMPTDNTGAGSSNCSGYVTRVDAMTPYDYTDTLQMPGFDNVDSFNLGVAGTPVHYQMFP
jgi:hypothetical protein